MNTLRSIILHTGFVLGLLTFLPAWGAEVSQVITEHEKQAAIYEQQAKAQEDVMAEHEQMMKDYKKRYYVNDKVTPPRILKPMETHCNAIITDAKKLRNEYREFAKWHRMRAAELHGK